MSPQPATVGIHIRPYDDADEQAVLDLLTTCLGRGPGGSRSAEFFRWKHVDNPFGPSQMWIAESSDQIVGLRAFMRWRFTVGERAFRAVRAVDTATHPDHQGRGIFSRLTREALDTLREEADFIFNTPNEKSLPGYLKMGWQVVGQVPISVRVRRPIRMATHARSWRTAVETEDGLETSAPPASQILMDDAILDLLDDRDEPAGLATPRDATYLRWRYGRAPLLGYRAVQTRADGRLDGLSVFRVRPRGSLAETTIAETIVRANDVRAAGRLMRTAARSARVDHLTCSFPSSSVACRAARRAGFVRVPGGMTMVVNTLGHELDPDPLDMTSWALSLGDLEVF